MTVKRPAAQSALPSSCWTYLWRTQIHPSFLSRKVHRNRAFQNNFILPLLPSVLTGTCVQVMASSFPIVQTQWSLDNTVFQAIAAFRALSTAAAYDNVQTQAVYAFEALGSSLLVADHRINEGLEALNPKLRQERFERLKLVLGLTPGGVGHLIQKRAPQCVPSFLLAVSLKTCLSDHEIGNVLYNMLVFQGLFRKPEFRASRMQMGDLVSSISGFGDSIVPQDVLKSVGDALQRTVANTSDMARVFWKAEDKVLAEIYSRLFDSLAKDNVDRITLHGITGGALITSSLTWLLSESVELSIDGKLALGKQGSRISVEVDASNSTNDTWTIREWSLQTSLSSVIITPDEESNPSKSSFDFLPASSAKSMLRPQYSLSDSEINIVGSIAMASVFLAVERGLVMTELRFPGIQQRFVKLETLCQSEYKTQIQSPLTCFGWERNEYCTEAMKTVKDIGEWIDSDCPELWRPKQGTGDPLLQAPVQQIGAVLNIVNNWRGKRTGCTVVPLEAKIVEPTIHVAAESLYSSSCCLFPKYRSFRACNFATLADNAMCILTSIFSRPLQKAWEKFVPPITPGVHNLMHTLTISQLRVRAMASAIPGAQIDNGHGGGLGESDIVFSRNGYVAVAEPLREISTYPSECVGIRVMAGYLWWDNEDASFEKLVSADPRGDVGIQCDNSSLESQRFCHDAKYLGLEPQGDQNALNVDYLVSVAAKRELSLTTYLCDPQTMDRTLVDFVHSIETIATSTHITDPPLPSSVESSLAQEWKAKNLWSTIRWTSANGRIDHARGTPIRYIGKTYNSEPLRFFLAGRRNMHKVFMRHGTTQLASCIQKALRYEEEEDSNSQNDRITAPWIEEEMLEQMSQPGWIIIC